MLVRALRGVCVGVERHLKPGDAADLDPATSQFLISIGAVEEVKEEPEKPKTSKAKPKPDASPDSEPVEPGK